MQARGSSFSGFLGSIAVAAGIVYLGIGFAHAFAGPEGIEGLLVGGLALVAGCVILWGRARRAKKDQNQSDRTDTGTGPDGRPVS